MPHASCIFHSLRSQPGYTLMRGAARFSTARRLVAGTRRAVGGRKAADYLADCDARIAQTQFPAVDRTAFVRTLRKDGLVFGLTVPVATVAAIHAYARQAVCYADRMCMHKGLTPTRSARLLLQLQYALFDYDAMHDRVDPVRLGRVA